MQPESHPHLFRFLWRLAIVAAWGLTVWAMLLAGLEPDFGKALALGWFVAFPLALVAVALMLGEPSDAA